MNLGSKHPESSELVLPQQTQTQNHKPFATLHVSNSTCLSDLPFSCFLLLSLASSCFLLLSQDKIKSSNMNSPSNKQAKHEQNGLQIISP